MGDQKDITDMSFEEFFSESKKKAERAEDKKIAAQPVGNDKIKSGRGFIGATPKINFNNGKFLLYVPRYEGRENDQFNVAVESGDRVVPMHRLDSVKQKGGRVSRPATLDLTPADVTPMDDFTVTIDGEKAFVNKAHPISFFNSVGSPVVRPMGEVTAVTRAGAPLKLFKAEILDTATKNGLTVMKVNVLVSGTVKVDENAQQVIEEEDVPAPEIIETEAVKEPKKKPAKRTVAKGEFTLSQPTSDADIIYGDERLPLYPGNPIATITVKGCEVGECVIRAEGKDGEVLNTSAAAQMYVNTGDYVGPVTVTLEKGAKKLCTARYFIIPGFQCSYSGKGDITDNTVVSYKMLGQEGTKDVSEDDPYSFQYDGMDFKVVWSVPYVTFDIGNGPQPFSSVELDINDLKGETMGVTVRGARKKALFFGGNGGKKRDITPEWTDETYYVDLEPIRDEVYSAPSSTHNLYITVNSFPTRLFMTIRNPVRVKARYEEGNIVADIDPSVSDCICRFFKIDKTTADVQISSENNTVPVPADVIEAEVIEMYKGQPRNTIKVTVRPLPFLHKDAMGDNWMYVSSTKRIPLPDDLIKDGKPDVPVIKSWHDRIVRMNPELKGVTFEMIQKAFKDFL